MNNIDRTTLAQLFPHIAAYRENPRTPAETMEKVTNTAKIL